jgi:protein-S-isoprenylcysteine O-methyltransferase Ste14
VVAALALALFALYLALAFGARTVLQLRRTGSTGFKGISGRPGSAEWSGGVLFVAALGLGLAAPVLDLVGAIEPVVVLDGRVGHALGFVLYGLGLAGTLAAQWAMGRSWRVGVEESEKTEKTDLVTTGPFAVVRNLIFSAMIPGFLGLALMVPNVCALAGVLALVVAVELQVRRVEEPYLTRAHGERYLAYASRVGRFAPGVGTIRPKSDRP